MSTKRIAIIGGGNLGYSIAQGLVKSEFIAPAHLTVTRRKVAQLAGLASLGVNTLSNNVEAVAAAETVVLAVKPHQIKMVLQEIAPALSASKHTLISVVTGVSIADMQTIVGKEVALFRAMPNTAIAIRESMTCIASNNTTEQQQQEVVDLFERLGKAVIIDESLMASATVLAACGIAYSLRFIRAASQGGIEIGFNSQISQLIAAQTVKGAASLLLENGQHPEQEIDKVTTPMGCTIAGLNEMEHQGFSSSLIKGVLTSYHKIADIADDFDRKK